nr:YkgJ family cysteine cluster protein [Chitinophagales bacterium]
QFKETTWKREALLKQKENKQFLAKAKRMRGIEKELPALHDEAFSKINCLNCANCCKTISPRFKNTDIVRIAKHLGMKQGELMDTYLRRDEDGDYVVNTLPCPFLGSDNYCGIYEVRPRDCENYPYTDSGEFFDYATTTYNNSTTCPAVFYVLERLKEIK